MVQIAALRDECLGIKRFVHALTGKGNNQPRVAALYFSSHSALHVSIRAENGELTPLIDVRKQIRFVSLTVINVRERRRKIYRKNVHIRRVLLVDESPDRPETL